MPVQIQAVEVPFDLTPLETMPPTISLSGTTTANGVELRATKFSRGVAVSTLELIASVTDPAALVPADDTTVRARWNQEVRAEVEGAAVPVIGGDVGGIEITATRTVRLFDLPDQGTLRLTLDWMFVAYTAGVEDIPFAEGPFEVVIELE